MGGCMVPEWVSAQLAQDSGGPRRQVLAWLVGLTLMPSTMRHHTSARGPGDTGGSRCQPHMSLQEHVAPERDRSWVGLGARLTWAMHLARAWGRTLGFMVVEAPYRAGMEWELQGCTEVFTLPIITVLGPLCMEGHPRYMRHPFTAHLRHTPAPQTSQRYPPIQARRLSSSCPEDATGHLADIVINTIMGVREVPSPI